MTAGGRPPTRPAVAGAGRPEPGRARRPRPSIFRAGRPHRRLVALLLLAVLTIGVVVARVGFLQTVSAPSLARYGERQRLSSVKIPAERGTVFDRDGAVLALSVPTTTIWADPRLVTDPAAESQALSQALGLSPEDAAALARRLGQPGKAPPQRTEFEYVARQVDDATAAKVAAMKLDGVNEYTEAKRFYPSGALVGRAARGH